MAGVRCQWNVPLTLKAHQGVIHVQQDEGQAKWEQPNDLLDYFRRSIKECNLPYPVQLRYRGLGAMFITSVHNNSYVAQAGWRPAEDVGTHAQGKPGTSLWTVSLRLRTLEKGLGKNLKRARTRPSCLVCPYPSGRQLHNAYSTHSG